MTEKKTDQSPPEPASADVTREELQQVMANPSYSAGTREGWLKEVLARLTAEPSPGESQRRLIRDIRDIILDVRTRDPKSRD